MWSTAHTYNIVRKSIQQSRGMPKLQKQQPPCLFLLKGLYIKVKFACRCFLEYALNQQLLKTRQIRVDSKNTHYEVDQAISLPWGQTGGSSRRQNEVRMAVKLLSSKGLSFTVGYLDISQSLARSSGQFEVKVSQTQDIEARCTFMVLRNANQSQYKTPSKQAADINLPPSSNQHINETNSSKSKGSRLEVEFEELKEDYYRLKDKFCKYEESSIVQGIDKFPFSEPRRTVYEERVCNNRCEQARQKNLGLQSRVRELQRQLRHNMELFSKQKDLLRIYEGNLKEKTHQCQQLKRKLHQATAKNEELYKANTLLEQEKIKYLMDQLKHDKENGNLGEYMAHMFEQIYKVIESMFKQKITNLTALAHSKELKLQAKRQSLTSPTSPIKKLFYSTDFKKCQQAMDNCPPAEDVSISGGQLSTSQIKSMNMINGEIAMRNVLKDFQPRVRALFSEQCIETMKSYCFKIQKIVNKSVQRLFKKIMELTSYNQAYKKKLNEEKAQYQNNEQSLIDYLQQLQEGLQTQLEIVKEKDIILERDQGIIHTLNQILLERQRRIHDLQQAYDRLQDEKNEIKAELHENNYLYAMKEEDFIRRIYELETGFVKPEAAETQHQPAKLRIIQRKPTVFSDNYDEDIINHRELDEIYESEVIYESPQLSTYKQEEREQIHAQRMPFSLYEESDQARLRHTMLKSHRLTLVNKLREQMANAENAESIDEKDEAQQEKEEKVIQEEFLKVLV